MDLNLIQKLKDAGVEDSVIVNLILQDGPQAEAAPVTEEVQPAAAPVQEASQPAAAPDPVLAKIDQLIGVIQASNLLHAGRESAPQETADDVLAAMLQPPKKGGK